MSTRNVWIRLLGSALTLLIFGAAAFGQISTASFDGTFTENGSGKTITLKLQINQGATTAPGPQADEHAGGVGNLAVYMGQPTLNSNGIPLSLCSVHGQSAHVFDPNTTPDGTGQFPLESIECGRAGVQTISLEKCMVVTSFHAFVHSDNPRIDYIGTATVDLTVNAMTGNAAIDIYTPKGTISLNGTLQGSGALSTCP